MSADGCRHIASIMNGFARLRTLHAPLFRRLSRDASVFISGLDDPEDLLDERSGIGEQSAVEMLQVIFERQTIGTMLRESS